MLVGGCSNAPSSMPSGLPVGFPAESRWCARGRAPLHSSRRMMWKAVYLSSHGTPDRRPPRRDAVRVGYVNRPGADMLGVTSDVQQEGGAPKAGALLRAWRSSTSSAPVPRRSRGKAVRPVVVGGVGVNDGAQDMRVDNLVETTGHTDQWPLDRRGLSSMPTKVA